MKTRFTTVDIIVILKEIQSVIGHRVVQVYDLDNKSYLLKLSSKEKKAVLLIESGARLHLTEFDWPKSNSPSGFTMKLRKHIHNRRLESARQLGIDRIVDLQFGSNEAAYHVILELYDKGNIVLTDHQYNILNILRPRTEGEDVKFAVRNVYPVDRAKQDGSLISKQELEEILISAKAGSNLKRVLNPKLIYGPAVIEHVLLKHGFSDNTKIGKGFNIENDISKLMIALDDAHSLLNDMKNSDTEGYILKKTENRPAENGESKPFLVNHEFHPFYYQQHEKCPFEKFPSFNKAVDEFFSKLESQKIDMKAIQMEKDALKKLDNVKNDHQRRISALEELQEEDRIKAQLIEMNLEFVDKAIYIVQRAIASQINWKEISELLAEARSNGDPIAKAIQDLKLNINHITMSLSDPYANADDEDDSFLSPRVVDIDLDLTAFANAKKYYDMKRHAATKEQKTIDSSKKAFKSAEKKTKQTLKEVVTVTNIKKARKVHWFEKFYWFISSENYLVIGGRDQQQNELIVKRYLRNGDIYVHADLHGASSIVIKNPSKNPVPPKTLNEAGTMAVCYSSAWEAKVITSAYWVFHDQVSKTAPTGEYLTTGSFMIRGKKNYLPPCHLVMGFGLLFKLADESIINHVDERKVKVTEDDSMDASSDIIKEDEEEINLDNESDDDNPPPEVEGSDVPTKEDEFSYPDTVVEMEHVGGDQFTIRHRTISTASEQSEEDVVYLGDKIPVQIQLKTAAKSTGLPNANAKQPVKEKGNEVKCEQPKNSKRGQKFRQKRMQEKYKDQDEDDRALALDLLKPDGPIKEPKHKGKKEKGHPKLNQRRPKVKQPVGLPNEQLGVIYEIDPSKSAEASVKSTEYAEKEEDDIEQEQLLIQEDAILLSSLTGIPLPDDVILYSIPLCGPYNCLTNFKYKVKLTPGTGKRGKAVKTALAMFLRDRNGNHHERDLIKSLKDQDASRNIPGKVKMSAPQLTKFKKR